MSEYTHKHKGKANGRGPRTMCGGEGYRVHHWTGVDCPKCLALKPKLKRVWVKG